MSNLFIYSNNKSSKLHSSSFPNFHFYPDPSFLQTNILKSLNVALKKSLVLRFFSGSIVTINNQSSKLFCALSENSLAAASSTPSTPNNVFKQPQIFFFSILFRLFSLLINFHCNYFLPLYTSPAYTIFNL